MQISMDDAFHLLCRGTNFSQTSKSRHVGFSTPSHKRSGEMALSPDEGLLRPAKRRKQLKVRGGEVPPLACFDEMEGLGYPSWILNSLRNVLLYTEPTEIQKLTFSNLCEAKHCMATAPTGTGKTVAFAVPLYFQLEEPTKEQFIRSILICPTRELARQCLEVVCVLGKTKKFRATLIEAKDKKMAQPHYFRLDVAVCTPEPMCRVLQNHPHALSRCRFVIMDECDKLLSLGFTQQIDTILAAATSEHRQIWMFSATTTHEVKSLAGTVLHAPLHLEVGSAQAANRDVSQQLLFCTRKAGRLPTLRQLLTAGSIDVPCLVFVEEKKDAHALFNELVFDGLLADVITSSRSNSERDRVVENFQAGRIWILICTDVVARGIDFKGVKMVVNWDVPTTVQRYVHRVGRCGRAGQTGRSLTLFTIEDAPLIRTIAPCLESSGCDVPKWIFDLKKQKQSIRKKFV